MKNGYNPSHEQVEINPEQSLIIFVIIHILTILYCLQETGAELTTALPKSVLFTE